MWGLETFFFFLNQASLQQMNLKRSIKMWLKCRLLALINGFNYVKLFRKYSQKDSPHFLQDFKRVRWVAGSWRGRRPTIWRRTAGVQSNCNLMASIEGAVYNHRQMLWGLQTKCLPLRSQWLLLKSVKTPVTHDEVVTEAALNVKNNSKVPKSTGATIFFSP